MLWPQMLKFFIRYGTFIFAAESHSQQAQKQEAEKYADYDIVLHQGVPGK